MSQKYKKKLIEVAIPLEAINKASAREKSIRHGHPSTLHLWWARRPLAACRAVLFCQLVDDPSEYVAELIANPTTKSAAQAELETRIELRKAARAAGTLTPAEDKPITLETVAIDLERRRLFAIVEDLVLWDNSTNEAVLNRAKAEILRCCDGVMPPVYDPFSGGASIPVEAQRLGLPAYGSDLNPVAVMIGKAMIEIPPKFKDRPPTHPGHNDRGFASYRNAEGLAEDVKYFGERVRELANERIGFLYPKVSVPKSFGGGEATALAWIWCRTVASPDPAYEGVHVPLASNFALCSKTGKTAWLQPIVDKGKRSIDFTIQRNGPVELLKVAKKGTKASRGANFTCLLSDSAITSEYVKEQASAGKLGERLLAVVVNINGRRDYLIPKDNQIEATKLASPEWVPTQKMDPKSTDLLSGRGYGVTDWSELFLQRQLHALNEFCEIISDLKNEILKSAKTIFDENDKKSIVDGGRGATAYVEAVTIYLSFSVSKALTRNCMLAIWETGMGRLAGALGRQALPMQWTFAETNPLAGAGGDISGTAKSISEVLEKLVLGNTGKVFQRNASSDIEMDIMPLISTDPPYYDNIEYADLSDFFYVWLRRNLKEIDPDLFGTLAVPKMEQLVASAHRYGSKEKAYDFFMTGMSEAIKNMAKQGNPKFPAAIYYAFKQSEVAEEGIMSAGWSSFLEAVLSAGYSIVGTWPIRTEATNALKKGMNALATSVVLVCRPREKNAEIITRAEFLRILKRELPRSIEHLQNANIAPADMPQSAIGPGMGVFSRYKSVLESDDSDMSVKTALQLINRELDEFLNSVQGEFDADTRFGISWFEQHGYEPGDFGAANNIAQARGISVESVKHAGIISSSAGKVKVLKRDELLDDWAPETDVHLTIWECCQYLIRTLETEGEVEAAYLLKRIGPDKAESVKELAYCLYDICANKRSDAKEATAYNGLIAVWSELTRQAASLPLTRGDGQIAMDV